MTKAERIFKDTRYECGKHYKAWGREYNSNGKPVTFGSLITEEPVSTRTFNAVQREIDKDRKTLEIAERLGALTPERIEERRYVEEGLSMKTIIDTYQVRNHTFTIVQQGDHYCAIDHKYLDGAGRLTQRLNGLQMYASTELGQCLQQAKDAVEMEWYIANGLTRAEAFAAVLGIPAESAEQLLRGGPDHDHSERF